MLSEVYAPRRIAHVQSKNDAAKVGIPVLVVKTKTGIRNGIRNPKWNPK